MLTTSHGVPIADNQNSLRAGTRGPTLLEDFVLQNALLRNVRLISAIGLHTGNMSIAESEAMFREKAFKDPGNARQQADRGTFDPGYGAYTLGKLMIRKLREDWTATRGGREAWQTFHDQLLSYARHLSPWCAGRC